MRHVFSPQSCRLRASLIAAFLGCMALATFSANVNAASDGRPVQIDIAKFGFAPKEITVAPGTRIVWTNRDEAPHTVTSTEKKFASKGMDTDDKFEHTFDSEGDFNYICTVHPFMTGIVHVRKQ